PFETLGEVPNSREVLPDEGWLHQKIFRWVTGEGQLGERDDVGAVVRSARVVVLDEGCVRRQVTDGRVDLCQSHPQRAQFTLTLPGRLKSLDRKHAPIWLRMLPVCVSPSRAAQG